MSGPCRPWQNPYSSHVSPLRARVEKGRPSSPSSVADAFRTTLDLFESGLDLMRQNLRRNHPAATDEEIDRFLREWLLERPGAESGDCSGRPVDVTTRLA